jgi:membrane protease YdiL (CAAX protease family)
VSAQTIQSSLFVFPLALIALGVIYRRGCLSRDVFDATPLRNTGLTGVDLMIALCLLLAGGSVVFSVLDAVGIPAGMDENGDKLEQTDRQMAWMVIISQLLTQLPIMLFILLKAGFARGGLRALGAAPSPVFRHVKLALVAFPAALAIVFAVNQLCIVMTELAGQPVPESGHSMLQRITSSRDSLAVVMMCFSAIIVAPIAEEFVYRGLLQSALLNWVGKEKRWLVIFGTAIIFGGIHAGVAPWQAVIGLTVFGVILGWLYEKTGNLWPSILVHMMFNIVNICLAMLTHK